MNRDTVNIGIASIPEREKFLEKTIESLLPQADRIYVVLNGYPEVPAFLEHDKIRVFTLKKDLGAAGKFYMAGKVDGYFFTCDDDLVYPPDYVNYFVHMIEMYKRKAVITAHGTLYPRHPITSYYNEPGRRVFYSHGGNDATRFVHMGGTGVMAYHFDTLPEFRMKDLKSKNMCDPYMAKYLHSKDVPVVCLVKAAGWVKEQAGSQDKAIWKGLTGNDKKQTEVINSIKNWSLKTSPVINRSRLADASISEELLISIFKLIPEGGKILELGSGAGTGELAKFYKMTSIEHDKSYLHKHNSKYIHAEIKDNFYDIKAADVRNKYDLLLIDGPPAHLGKRSAFLDHAEKFDLTVPIIVDDVHREDEQKLTEGLAELTGRKYEVIKAGDKSFAVFE